MKRNILSLISVSAALVALASTVGCGSDGGSNTLTNGGATTHTPNTTPGDNGDYTHNQDPSAPGSGENQVDPGQIQIQGSPEVTSRLHGCGKLSVASLGQLLTSRGLTGNTGLPQGAQSAQQIYSAGDTAAALGGPNYSARVPEAPFSTTSSVSKMFDIFTMASYEAVADAWTAPDSCPGVKILDGGKFTKDGISCLIGKPATDEHVAIANDAIAKNPADGAKIAVGALLSAAHTCQ